MFFKKEKRRQFKTVKDKHAVIQEWRSHYASEWANSEGKKKRVAEMLFDANRK